VIPNLNRWFDDILAGTLKPMDDFDGSQQRAAVPVTVYRMDPSGGQNPEMVGADLNLFALRLAGA
jgi:hypothetical protein